MIDLREEPTSDFREHAGIPSVFESQSIYDVRLVSGGFELVERALIVPFRKNYDCFESPLAWSRELGTTQSVLISAFSGDRRVGGIIAAVVVPGLVDWSARHGTAVLWDLRVGPAHRRQSVATSLLQAVQAWARQRGCADLAVESQNTNVAACKFYMHNGFVLGDVRHGAYSQLPEEVQLIWRKTLNG